MRRAPIDRAAFLAGGGMLLVTFALPGAARAQQQQSAPGSGQSEARTQGAAQYPNVDSWLAIDRSGDVTVFFGKAELGTGTRTALAQLVADDLDVAFARIEVVEPDTVRTPNQGYTAGSQTLTSGALPVRQAAATARVVLLELASAALGVPVARLQTREGMVFVEGEPSRARSYGALIGGKRIDRAVDQRAPLADRSRRRATGKSVPRVDLPAKVTGEFRYAHDVVVPGMQHGRVVLPPRPGASVASIDQSPLAALGAPVQVVRKGNFVGVVAAKEHDAVRAAEVLAVRWNPGPTLDQAALPGFVRTTPQTPRVLVQTGAPLFALRSPRTLRSTYTWPFQSHASIGPSCAVADVRSSGATVWSATQGVYPLRGALAQLLGVPAESVHVTYVEGSGCYGHNGADDATAAAALLSQAAGVPVRVQYSRLDETRWDPKGPSMVMDVRGVLDRDFTKIVGWEYAVWTPSHSGRPDGQASRLLPGILEGTFPSTPATSFTGGDRNAKTNYDLPAQRVVIYDQPDAVVRQSALRGLGGTQNTFANESFIDELVHVAQADPIDFRLAHLSDDRARAVLEAARKNYRKGRGVAFVRYENTGAYVAAVADVAVDRASGAVRVQTVWIAHDCGTIVNPDGLRNQIEGNVVQAASRALLEEVRFGPDGVSSVDWRTYPILRFGDVPDVVITLIDRPGERIVGAGEATTTVVAPAIANAIFAQTGARVRAVPFTRERVLEALSG